MNLHDYLSSPGAMSGSELARRLKVPPALISQWKGWFQDPRPEGSRLTPAERCLELERETGGVVCCEDQRPDINWSRSARKSQRVASHRETV